MQNNKTKQYKNEKKFKQYKKYKTIKKKKHNIKKSLNTIFCVDRNEGNSSKSCVIIFDLRANFLNFLLKFF